ncbi:MAG: amidohydrolase family protein [Acidimicrobiales bacterium]
MTGLLVVDVELPTGRADIRCRDGRVQEVGPDLAPRRGETVLRGAAAALPGLHDHHLHLMAMAARATSLDVGPGVVSDAADLGRVLRDAAARTAPGAWLRAVGYDEGIAGRLDRRALDALVGDRPVRVQHRSGHLWVLSSVACRALEVDRDRAPGVERDPVGVPTGRLVDRDGWLGSHLPQGDPPDLGGVSRRLAAYGVTGVTDATPTAEAADLAALADARCAGTLVQRVTVMGGIGLAGARAPAGLALGPTKIVVSDSSYPGVDELAEQVAVAHRCGRPVAVHCVTRIAAVLAVAAWELAGSRAGDRMEHGAVLPPDLVDRLSVLGVTVVTQPSFVLERGDDYLREVEADDRPHLYRCASLQRHGVGVGGSTDAPFGPDDPWVAMSAAVGRRTRSGAVVGAGERLSPVRALALFLSDSRDPGGSVREVRPGVPADLCLLDCDLDRSLEDLDAGHVVATAVGGRLVHEA